MKQGDVVILRKALLGNEIGTVGVCYEEYDLNGHNGASFIFENGNHDGFAGNEQEHFLFVVDYDIMASEYNFYNVLDLHEDFCKGYFNNVFLISDSEKLKYLQMLREDKIDSIVD